MQEDELQHKPMSMLLLECRNCQNGEIDGDELNNCESSRDVDREDLSEKENDSEKDNDWMNIITIFVFFAPILLRFPRINK